MMNPAGSGVQDFKGELNQFLQKHCKRPLSKQDIVYTVSKFSGQSQAIVKLNCLEGQEYAGHLCADAKSAEKSAAEQALQANFVLVQAAKEAQPKRMLSAEDTFSAEKRARVDPSQNPSLTPKTELNSLIGKIAKKVLQKGETVYVANKIGHFYQATVQSAALPDEWASRAWAGELSATKPQAEQSAAEQALKDIKADPELMERANRTGKPGGKGQKFKAEAGAEGEGGFGRGKKGWNWGQMMQMMKTFMKQGGASMLREAVTEDFVTGTVLEWKGKFGWIQPDVPIEHEYAKYRDGKIWVSMKDLAGVEELTEGQRVKFKVYVDPSGLGAEETTML